MMNRRIVACSLPNLSKFLVRAQQPPPTNLHYIPRHCPVLVLLPHTYIAESSLNFVSLCFRRHPTETVVLLLACIFRALQSQSGATD